jgi:hypothetical protein
MAVRHGNTSLGLGTTASPTVPPTNQLTTSSGTLTWNSDPKIPTLASGDIFKVTVEPNTSKAEIVYVVGPYTTGSTSASGCTRNAEPTQGGQNSSAEHTNVAWAHGLTVRDLGRADVYNVIDWGLAADGSTDDTSALNTLLATVVTNGGGDVYIPAGKTVLCSGQVLPQAFGATAPHVRIFGAGHGKGDVSATGSSTLDLRYASAANLAVTATGGTLTLTWNGLTTGTINASGISASSIQTALRSLTGGGAITVTGASSPFTITALGNFTLTANVASLTGGSAFCTNQPKIFAAGSAQLEIDHLLLKSGGSDNFPFFETTNCGVYGHDLTVQGNTSNSGNQCVQDGFVCGGSNFGSITTGKIDAPFQAYSTRFQRVFFSKIRSGFVLNAAANAIVIDSCVAAADCGGDQTHGWVTTNGTSVPVTNSVWNNNLIESTHYPYPFVLGTSTNQCKGNGNGLWDAAAWATTTTLTNGSASGTSLVLITVNTVPAMTVGEQIALVDSVGGVQLFTVNAAYAGGAGTLTIVSQTVTLASGNSYAISIARATVSDASGNTGNRFTNTYSSIPNDYPDTMSKITIVNTAYTNYHHSGPNGTYLIEGVGSGGGGGSGGTPNSSLNNQVGGCGGSQGGYAQALASLTNGTNYTIAIGAAAAAGTTTAANGNSGASGNTGNTTTFNTGSITVTGESGVGGAGGTASSTTAQSGSQATTFQNTNATSTGLSSPDGWGGSNFSYSNITGKGGGPIGLGAGGGGAGGNATTTHGGNGGSPGAFGTAFGGGGGGSATVNGTDASPASSTSYGAGGGGGGAGATNAGTGGKGGASGPGVIYITGPFPD